MKTMFYLLRCNAVVLLFSANMTATPATHENNSNCGTRALFQVAQILQPGDERPATLLETPAPSKGFSLTELVLFSERYHLGLVPVERLGAERLPVPSVVHLRQGHYVAIVARQGEKYQVYDPSLGEAQWQNGSSLNRNASGFFLIPEQQLADGWHALSTDQTDAILGRGYPTSIDDGQ